MWLNLTQLCGKLIHALGSVDPSRGEGRGEGEGRGGEGSGGEGGKGREGGREG